jgi:hypothetical protein
MVSKRSTLDPDCEVLEHSGVESPQKSPTRRQVLPSVRLDHRCLAEVHGDEVDAIEHNRTTGVDERDGPPETSETEARDDQEHHEADRNRALDQRDAMHGDGLRGLSVNCTDQDVDVVGLTHEFSETGMETFHALTIAVNSVSNDQHRRSLVVFDEGLWH